MRISPSSDEGKFVGNKADQVWLLEASAGIEPAYKDLQSSASPLRHEASTICVFKSWRGFRMIDRNPQEGTFGIGTFLFCINVSSVLWTGRGHSVPRRNTPTLAL